MVMPGDQPGWEGGGGTGSRWNWLMHELEGAVHGNDQVTRTLKGNEKQFELEGNLTYQDKFQ